MKFPLFLLIILLFATNNEANSLSSSSSSRGLEVSNFEQTTVTYKYVKNRFKSRTRQIKAVAVKTENIIRSEEKAKKLEGSKFGNFLRRCPYFGGLLGALGDLGSGSAQTIVGVVSFGRSKTLERGIQLLKSGTKETLKIVVKDTYAGVIGLSFGTVSSTSSWGKDALQKLLKGDILGCFKTMGILTMDLFIPEYGWWNGWRWGSSQFGNHGPKPINQGGRAGYIHDNNLIDKDWVLRFKGKDLSNSTPNGIIGGFIGILGSIPFTILDRNEDASELK